MGRDRENKGRGQRHAQPTRQDVRPCCHGQTNLHLLHYLLHAEAHAATHRPEFDEILQHGGCDEQTVHQRVGKEEDEELVIGESHAVVHPGDAQLQM